MITPRLYITLMLSMIALNLFAQPNYPTRTTKHLFWQPGTKLSTADFKGDTIGGKYKESYKKVGLQAMSYLGLWSVLDVPKKKKDRGKLLEKVYITPAFDMLLSYIVTTDTNVIAFEQLCFDITEMVARKARREMAALQDSTKAYGTLWIAYSTVVEQAKAEKSGIIGSCTRDVIIDKKPGAYLDWRKIINNQLSQLADWASKPEDCYRFISEKPLDERYEKSPTIVNAFPRTN